MESDAEYRWPQAVHPRVELERGFRDALLVPKALGLWATEERATGRYIGRCGLYPQAFGSLGALRIHAGVHRENARSRGVVERLGFTLVEPVVATSSPALDFVLDGSTLSGRG